MQKNIKFLLKLFFVILLLIILLFVIVLLYYMMHIGGIHNKSAIVIILTTLPLLLVFFNGVFYSFHMNKTKLFGRWSLTIFKGFGLLIAVDDDQTIVFIIGYFGITFKYGGLFKKTSNLKSENKF